MFDSLIQIAFFLCNKNCITHIQIILEIRLPKWKKIISLSLGWCPACKNEHVNCSEDLPPYPPFSVDDFGFLICSILKSSMRSPWGRSNFHQQPNSFCGLYIKYSSWGCKTWGQFKCLCCYVLPHKTHNLQTKNAGRTGYGYLWTDEKPS